MANPNDANIIVNGQKVVATVAQSGTVVKDGGEIDATSVIQTDSGLQKVVKVMDINGGGGGSATWGDISGTLSDQTDLKTALDTKLQNTATGTSSLSILGTSTSNANSMNIGVNSLVLSPNSVVIGKDASCGSGGGATCIGVSSEASGSGVGIGYMGRATGYKSIQLGTGYNTVANQFQVYTFPMLDGNTGKIPNERLRITVADTSSTSATIANVEGGKDYTFSQALTALSITAITSSFVEANIYFTADTGIAVTLPANTPTIGDFTFTAGKSYVISIQNGIAVRGELN